ncbi:EAL domain-containing protein [Lederbergia graminis]|uniref:EAL domain-containing protein n=1 Tax=Lederbergia graminis TaxID=735518 RepID=A0ABW0LHJ8_9BACI
MVNFPFLKNKKNKQDDEQYLTSSEETTEYLEIKEKLKITEQQKHAYEKRIQYLIHHDHVTDLPNRTLFDRKIEELIMESSLKDANFTVMYLDVDRFRQINESLGHVIGEKLIMQFSQRMKKLLNKDSLLARVGGDEFGIILWNYSDAKYPEFTANWILDDLNEYFVVEDIEFRITTSIGISSFPADGQTKDELVKAAEVALFRAKKNGKNTYQIYSATMDINSYKNFYLDRDLRKSIENNELVVYLQPRVDTFTGKLISAEALVRWEHPVWGLVSPSEFIPIAEDSGFINEIGDWVLEEVCHFIQSCEKKKITTIPISINISAQRFLRNDWKDKLIHILRKTNTDPNLLEFEITERTLIQYEQDVEAALKYIKGLGIKIALDDFGTGYSSLSYIKDFSIDTIKIDRSFISQIAKSCDVEVIIKTLLYMTKELKMNVVAEGVETEVQLDFLKQHGCKEIQGYIYSKPVTIEEFQALQSESILKLHDPSQHKRVGVPIKRKYFRIDLHYPLKAKMTLTSIKGKEVKLGKTDVLIENIGPGGLKFLSNIHLPIRSDIFFQFDTKILNEPITLSGYIVWKEEVQDIYQYGLQLEIEEQDRDHLIKVLNNLTVQLRKTTKLPNCNFILVDKIDYIKKLQKE